MESELKIIDERELLGKQFKIYGDLENPLFLAKDIAEWIDYSKSGNGSYNLTNMLKKRNGTTLITSHDLFLTAETSPHIQFLKNGKISWINDKADIEVEELKEKYKEFS